MHCLQSGEQGLQGAWGACGCCKGKSNGAESVGSAGNGTSHSDPQTLPITNAGSIGARGPTGLNADHRDSTSSELDTEPSNPLRLELIPGILSGWPCKNTQYLVIMFFLFTRRQCFLFEKVEYIFKQGLFFCYSLYNYIRVILCCSANF